MTMHKNEKIVVCEVGPRDGLQNERVILSIARKVELIELAQDAGAEIIEVGSFVSPTAVPALADTDEVMKRIKRKENVEYRALILNMRGLLRAEEAGLEKVKITVSASRSHSLKNSGRTPEEVVRGLGETVNYAEKKGLVLSGAIATSFGCPFEGRVTLEDVLAIVRAFVDLGITEVSLSDTTGMANPQQVFVYCTEAARRFPQVVWNLHFHNTRGLGFANVYAGMQAGVNRFDASFAGLGGCPFAPGASGNIATEDLLHMCKEMGLKTAYRLDKAIELAKKVRHYVGHDTESFILKAGAIHYEPNSFR